MLRDKIIGAVDIMSNEDLEFLWSYITNNITTTHKTASQLSSQQVKAYLDSIEPVEPDEKDLEMLAEIQNNPDCMDFD